MIKFCCDGFKQLTEQVGEKGYSIIAYRDGEYRIFYLQARPFEQDVIDKYNSIDNISKENKWPELFNKQGQPVPWVFALDIALTYCPSCGTCLEKIIRKYQKEFDSLAIKNHEETTPC